MNRSSLGKVLVSTFYGLRGLGEHRVRLTGLAGISFDFQKKMEVTVVLRSDHRCFIIILILVKIYELYYV